MYKNEQTDMAIYIRGAVADIVRKLPYLITVEKKSGGIFHVLHAELPKMPEPITDEVMADENELAAIAMRHSGDGEMIIWGRYIFYPFYNKVLDEHFIQKTKRRIEMERKRYIYNDRLSHIYSGHTICRQPIQFIGQTNLDTMAYGSYSYNTSNGVQSPPPWAGLTVTEPETGKFWLVNDREFKEVQPLVFE